MFLDLYNYSSENQNQFVSWKFTFFLFSAKIRPTQATADADDYDPYDDGEYPSDDDYLYGDDDDPVLTDDKPTALSDFADLLPPYFDVAPMQKTVVVGETVTLPCNAKNLKGKRLR